MSKFHKDIDYINNLKETGTDGGLKKFLPGEVAQNEETDMLHLFRNKPNTKDSKMSLAQIASKMNRGSGSSNFPSDSDLNFLSSIGKRTSNLASLKREPKKFHSDANTKLSKIREPSESFLTPPRSRTKDNSDEYTIMKSDRKRINPMTSPDRWHLVSYFQPSFLIILGG